VGTGLAIRIGARIGAVMAGSAHAGGSRVVHRGRIERDEILVADIARAGGRNVGAGLRQARTAALVAVGAGVAADDGRRRRGGMIEGDRGPGRCRLVADVALSRCGGVAA